MTTNEAVPPTSSRLLVSAASAVVILAGLRAGAPFLVPLMLAVFVAVITFPALRWLQRLGVPTPIAVLVVVLSTFGVLGVLGWVGVASLGEMQRELPIYIERFQAVERALFAALEARGVPVPAGLYELLAQPERLVGFASGFLLQAAEIVSVAFIVILYTIFMLAEATGFPRKLRAAIGRVDADLSRAAKAVRDIQRYLAIKTLISLVTGLLVGLWLWAVGVDFPLLWGTVAFLFNYVPNVGSVVAAIPGVLIALLQLGTGGALLTAGGYVAVNFLIGNILEPHVMGRGFGLSTLVVVVSLVFWGWLWGPVGMLLSVPLTVVGRIALEHTHDFRWLAVLLGTGPPESLPDADEPVLPAAETLRAGG